MGKPTIPIESRIDVRILATLLKYYTKQNILIDSKSRLVSHALEDFITHLVESNLIVPSTSVEQSLLCIDRAGFGAGRRKPSRSIFKHITNEVVGKDESAVVPADLLDEVLDKMKNGDNNHADDRETKEDGTG